MAAEDKEQGTSSEQASSPPHEAIFFVLAYLPLMELLNMTRVSKSLRDAINSDILLWLEIAISPPLSRRVTDDILLKVVSKAEGRLRVLVLINCTRVTDDCLLTVAAQNPAIFKLHLPGCTSLSAAGIIGAMKMLTNNLKTLRINGIYGIRKQHLITIEDLISFPEQQQKQTYLFYHKYKKFTCLELGQRPNVVDYPLDVDVCPKCDQVTMVFNCPPQASCRKNMPRGGDFEHYYGCWGCEWCIERCIECGVCTDEDAEKASCGDTLCLQCWLQLPKCNFCNKPYCNLHAHAPDSSRPCSSGFICSPCHSKYVSL